jgi:hypothetical protein
MSERYARSCGGKKRYPSARRANVAVRESKRKFGIELNEYFCEFCHQWHVGATYPQQGRTARTEELATREAQ